MDNTINNRELINDIEVIITVELGKQKLPIKELLKLTPGSLVHLNSSSNEPLQFFANGKLMGRCEIVTVNDKYGFRIVELYTKNNLKSF